MADDTNEIRISIVLDDGSVREGFARIKTEGDDTGKSLGDAFSSAKNQLLALLGAYIGFEAGKKFIEDSINAAAGYEAALNNMNKALSSAGAYSKDASAGFVQLAESIEATTTTSVKSALGLEALARNYAATNEQAKALTKAAIDLAAATGKSADTALQQLGGTLDGTAGRLAKLVPQLRGLTEYQLRMGDAIAIVGARFKDAASGDVNTYQGALARLSNAFEKLQTAFGNIITSSPSIRAAILFITEQLNQTANAVNNLQKNSDVFAKLLNEATQFGIGFTTFVVAPLEYTYHLTKLVVDGFAVVLGSVQGFTAEAKNALAESSPGKFLGQFFDTTDAKQKRLEAVKEWRDTLKDFQDAKNDYGDFSLSQSIVDSLEKFQTAVSNTKPIVQEFKTATNDINQDLLRMSGAVTSVGDGFQKMWQGASSSMKLLAADATKYLEQVGATAIKNLAGGVGNAFAAMGRAAVKGQDIFKAFAGAMIGAIGGALIQLGASYILIGLAREFASYGADPTGYELIGIGAGMAALGGVLSAVGEGVSGGGASASTSASGGGGAVSASSSPVTGSPANQVAAPKASVTVQINGSVFDTKETGLRIVELVNDAFTTQGAQVLVK